MVLKNAYTIATASTIINNIKTNLLLVIPSNPGNNQLIIVLKVRIIFVVSVTSAAGRIPTNVSDSI